MIGIQNRFKPVSNTEQNRTKPVYSHDQQQRVRIDPIYEIIPEQVKLEFLKTLV